MRCRTVVKSWEAERATFGGLSLDSLPRLTLGVCASSSVVRRVERFVAQLHP